MWYATSPHLGLQSWPNLGGVGVSFVSSGRLWKLSIEIEWQDQTLQGEECSVQTEYLVHSLYTEEIAVQCF